MEGEDEVCDPVADVVAAADGEDCFVADIVSGHVGTDSGVFAADILLEMKMGTLLPSGMKTDVRG